MEVPVPEAWCMWKGISEDEDKNIELFNKSSIKY